MLSCSSFSHSQVVPHQPHECGTGVSVRRVLFPGVPDGFFPFRDGECYVVCHVCTTIDSWNR